jgi:uncharacterized membrane protein
MVASNPQMSGAVPIEPPKATGHASDEALAALIVERAWAEERERRRQQPLPGWVRLSLRALPRVLALVSIANGVIGLVAVLAPLLRHALGQAATAPIYAAYALICPQRPSHTWFIGAVPMAMEQRMVAMYLAFGLAGALYAVWSRRSRPFPVLPTWIALLAVAPVLIDVAISTVEIRPSTAFSRLWTGALSAVAIVWWAYPRFDGELRRVRQHMVRQTPHSSEDPVP